MTTNRRKKSSGKLTAVSSKPTETPRPYLSWSQFHLVETSTVQYRKRYFENVKLETKSLGLGKRIATSVELGTKRADSMEQFVAEMLPRFPENEYEILEEAGGVPLLGKLDGFDPKKLHIGEYKTGLVHQFWTQERADSDEQLTFYSLLVWLKYKKLPKKITLYWAKAEYDEKKRPKLTGEIVEFHTSRKMTDIAKLLPRTKRAWETVKKMYREETAKAGLV